MKKILLIGTAVAISLSAGAQLKRATAVTDIARKKVPMELVKKNRPVPNHEEAFINKTGQVMHGSKSVLGDRDVWYDRPAGAFSNVAVTDVKGNYIGNYDYKMFYTKPYEFSTLKAHINGAEGIPNLITVWEYYPLGAGGEPDLFYDENMEFVMSNGFWGYEVLPIFHAIIGEDITDPNAEWHSYQSLTSGSKNNYLLSLPTPDIVYGEDGLYNFGYKFYWSQKTFVTGGKFGDVPHEITYMTGVGAPGINPNENSDDISKIGKGTWFGKNSGVWEQDYYGNWYQSAHLDGFAQVFEKPDRPYLLRDIGIDFYYMKQEAPVEMECKVYKLEEVPAYDDYTSVSLPYVPGELIAKGRATLRPEKIDASYANSQFVVFYLLAEEDGIEYEITPTIDCPIMVTIEGYNDIPELTEFTAMISSDYHSDEGFGETAYVLYEFADENHEFHGDYQWFGLNNFTFAGEMKTGFHMGLNIEYPFMKTMAGDYFFDEDTEYTFGREGGEMHREVTIDTEYGEETYSVDGVQFWSWYPSIEEDWWITWNDSEILPDWLDIQLVDGEEMIMPIELDDYGNTGDLRIGIDVTAKVTCAPLPAGMNYREATIRFNIPGEYRYYTFKQRGDNILKGDLDKDGEISIADVTMLIDFVLNDTELSEEMKACCDINEDSDIDISDVIALIDIVLG